ncbi:hypothetical protein [Methanoculleus sp.]|uniref:hypothetical protein n=1 Tax=Methanoculleus sp. TaxID=90427 RepID=UPI002FC7323B
MTGTDMPAPENQAACQRPGWPGYIRNGSGVVGSALLFRAVRPGERLCSRWSLQDVALVLCGVRDRERPHSLSTASQRDGWRRACSRLEAPIDAIDGSRRADECG